MSLLALLAPENIDTSRAVKLAITHDLAECIVGDITPFDGIPKDAKHQMELDAMNSIVGLLGNTVAAKEIYDLWMEYETQSSNEAIFVKDLDKLEMCCQALEYEKSKSSFCIRRIAHDYGKRVEKHSTLLVLLTLADVFMFHVCDRGRLWPVANLSCGVLLGTGKDLQSFFESTNGKFKTTTVQDWMNQLNKERNEYHHNTKTNQAE